MAVSRLDLSDVAVLLRTSDEELSANFTVHEILAALHVAANDERRRGREREAIALFERILVHNPNDQNVRVALAEYANRDGDLARVVEVLEPARATLAGNPVYAAAATMLVDARIRTVGAGQAQDLRAEAAMLSADEPRALFLRRRLAILEQLDVLAPERGRHSGPDALLWTGFMARSEHELLLLLSDVRSSVARGGDLPSLSSLAGTLAICRETGWIRPYELAFDLLDRKLAGSVPTETEALLARAGLGAPAVRLLRREFEPEGRPTVLPLPDALARFRDRSTVESARSVWAAGLGAGEYDRVLATMPSATRGDPAEVRTDDPGFDLAQVLAARHAPATEETGGARLARLWYVITWHEDADRLLRLVGMLWAPHVTIVISVGGARPPRELSALSSLLLLDNVHVLFRPVVTWGGQRLLYQNMYAVMAAFLASDGEWMQIICNRSFPLLSTRTVGRLLAEDGFLRRFPGVPGPPAWRGEWADETAERIDEVYGAAMSGIFSAADMTSFKELADQDYKLGSSVFNFSDKAETLDGSFKDGSHSYDVSAFGTDMRWMSFSRLGEFVDVSTEIGRTFTRRLHPLVAQWVRRTINKSELRTGDPFVLLSRRYAETALHDPEAVELFAAMNLGFAPEMNSFDTLAMTERFGLRHEMAHLYHRNDMQEAREVDVPGASLASETSRAMFMRKTWPHCSKGFVSFFSGKIGAEWPADETHVVARVGSLPTGSEAFPDIRSLLEPLIAALDIRLRKLTGEPIGSARFQDDGRVTLGGDTIGRWEWQGSDLVVAYDNPAFGTKTYRRTASDGKSLTLVPAELVSVRNGWSVFLDVHLHQLRQQGQTSADGAVRDMDGALKSVSTWTVSRSPVASLLEAFVGADHPDYAVPVKRVPGRIVESRRAGDRVLCLCEIDGWPALLRVESVSGVPGTATLALRRATGRDAATWDDALPAALPSPTVARSALAGDYRLSTLTGSSAMRLMPDGTILDGNGNGAGSWLVAAGAVWFLGHPLLKFGKATQFDAPNGGRWRMSGWAWANVEDRITFAVAPDRPLE